jgi:hypothetical protein
MAVAKTENTNKKTENKRELKIEAHTPPQSFKPLRSIAGPQHSGDMVECPVSPTSSFA